MSGTGSPSYTVSKTVVQPEMCGLWDGPVCGSVPVCDVNIFRPESGAHRPITTCKLLHDELGISGIFRVQDNYLKCVHRNFQGHVWKDSCVEIFLQPIEGSGYLNFEFNCLGYLHSSCISAAGRVDGRLSDSVPLTPDENDLIPRFHSIQDSTLKGGDAPLTWYLEFFIPFTIFEKYLGTLPTSETWRGNIYKCGDETTYPHWASWSPLDKLNFHVPDNFGYFRFE
jgi:hypothetical protein